MLKRRETIIYLALAVGTIILTLLQLNQTFFLYGIGQFLLYLIFGCTLLYNIIRLFRDKRQVSLIEKSKSLLFGLTVTGCLFLLSYLVDTDGGKKRIIIAGFNHDLNFVYFQLFRDNTFKLLNSGPFGGTFHRGTYSLRNDTLKIDNDSLKKLYPSLTLILKQKDDKTKYFEPVDSLKSMYSLRIYNDFRKR